MGCIKEPLRYKRPAHAGRFLWYTSRMKRIILYTDGGARGNPGPAGAGAVITDESGKVLKEISKFLGRQTNNWAEYEAVILGLEALKKIFSAEKRKELDIEIKMDSELVARQLSGDRKSVV